MFALRKRCPSCPSIGAIPRGSSSTVCTAQASRFGNRSGRLRARGAQSRTASTLSSLKALRLAVTITELCRRSSWSLPLLRRSRRCRCLRWAASPLDATLRRSWRWGPSEAGWGRASSPARRLSLIRNTSSVCSKRRAPRHDSVRCMGPPCRTSIRCACSTWGWRGSSPDTKTAPRRNLQSQPLIATMNLMGETIPLHRRGEILPRLVRALVFRVSS